MRGPDLRPQHVAAQLGRRAFDVVADARAHEGIRPRPIRMNQQLSVEERVNLALDKVRPAIQADGGEVWLIKVENDTAYVQMLGACGGCPASTMTLKGAIEAVVVSDVPAVQATLQV